MVTVVATLSVSFVTIQEIYYPDHIRNGRRMNTTDQQDLHFIMGPGIAFCAGIIQVVTTFYFLGDTIGTRKNPESLQAPLTVKISDLVAELISCIRPNSRS